MKSNILNLTRLLVGIVLVGALASLLYTFFASRASQAGGQPQPSQTGGQSQFPEPLTPTFPATSEIIEPLTSTLPATSEIVEPLTSTLPTTSDLTELLTPIPTATYDFDSNPPFLNQPPSTAYLYSDEVDAIEGRILAQGENPNATADSLLKSYRLEELDLPHPITIDGTTTRISVVWRLTIQGGQFRGGAQFWYIWIDDVPSFAKINWDGSEISHVFVDRSLLRNGSTIFVSYGNYRMLEEFMILELIDDSQ